MSFRVTYFLFLGFIACTDPVDQISLEIAAYFPLEVGNTWRYQMDETQIDITGEIHEVYELRVSVTSTITNPDESTTYVIHRERKDGDTWTPVDTWSARINKRELVITEDGTSFVKLSYPIISGNTWNGNSFNALGGEQLCGSDDERCDVYQYEQVAQPVQVETNGFENTITVLQNNNTDIIVSQDVRKEVYAYGVGLVYKESTVLEYCTEPSCLGQQEVVQGYILKQSIIL